MPEIKEKRCCSCKQQVPVELFGKCKTYSDGLMVTCKACASAKAKSPETLAWRRQYDKARRAGLPPRRKVFPEGTKGCFRCKEIKPLDAFDRNKVAKLGVGAYCKKCLHDEVTSPEAREKRRAYSKLAYKRRKEQGTAIAPSDQKYRASEKGKAALNKAVREYKRRYPEKERARWETKKAIKSGKLIKQPCSVCGDPKSQAHHEDYSKPLEVMWLCQKHHTEVHGWSV